MLDYAKEITDLLKVLANQNRLLIVCHLIDKPMNVSELHQGLGGLTQSALSQHLSILRAHRILDSNKSGLTITYSIRDERIANLIEVLKKSYCEV